MACAAVSQPVFRGRQPVSGLWLPHGGLDEATRARRLLAHWRHGATAWRFAQGDLLRYPAPWDTVCETLAGWPLCRRGAVLCSAPLTEAEAAVQSAADVWLVQGGQVLALNFTDAQALDPSHWLGLGSLTLHDTYDCRDAMAEPVVLLPADARDLREVLDGRVPPASAAQRDFLQAMARQGGRAGRGAAPGRSRRFPGGGFLRTWVGVAGTLVGLALLGGLLSSGVPFNPLWFAAALAVFWLARRWRAAGSQWLSSGEASGAAKPRPAEGPALPERGKGTVKPQAWRQWLARLAVTSQVAQWLGRRQAAYLRKMMALFEGGDIAEALRHAVPLGDDTPSLGQAFGTPGRRDDLALSAQGGAASSIHLGDDLSNYLQRLYRQSFEKLAREERIDEAVFVLAELLRVRHEALEFLEKHGRFKQAAELALAWDQTPEVIVRLHCLAGDWRRAVAVARRDNAFANAVLQLESRWPDAAARLREEWAQALAARGDWVAAVEALWPVAARRELAIEWLLSAEAAGGTLGARALVQRAVLLPQTMTQCAERLHALRDDPARHGERGAVASALLGLKNNPADIAGLARLVAPGVLADHAAGHGRLASQALQRLLALAGDAWLSADLPAKALPAFKGQALNLNKDTVLGEVPDAGVRPVLDAVALDDDRYLLALGEAGAVVVDAHGRVLSRFAVPAQRIVIAHSRQVALVMAARDSLWRVSRLDLPNRRVVDLGVAELPCVASEFGGIAWTVARGNRLAVLDTQHALDQVLWQVADLPGQIRGLSVNANVEQMALENERGQWELWRYTLPHRRLLVRGEALPEPPSQDVHARLLNPNGGVIDLCLDATEGGCLHRLSYTLHGRTLLVALPHLAEGAVQNLAGVVRGNWLMVGVTQGALMHWHVVALGTGFLHARIAWPAAAEPQARIVEGHCLVHDREGRLWDLDTETSGTRRLALV